MAPPSSPPSYLYKIVHSSTPPPSDIPAALPLSPLDAKDGFIHLSTSAQIVGTLKRFFTTDSYIYILRIPYSKVEHFIKWESPEGKESERQWSWEEEKELFPHIYGNAQDGSCKLGRDEVKEAARWKRIGDVWSAKGWPFEQDEPKTK